MEQVQSREQTKRFSLNTNRALTPVAIGQYVYSVLPRNPSVNQENKLSWNIIGTFRKNQEENQFSFVGRCGNGCREHSEDEVSLSKVHTSRGHPLLASVYTVGVRYKICIYV